MVTVCWSGGCCSAILLVHSTPTWLQIPENDSFLPCQWSGSLQPFSHVIQMPLCHVPHQIYYARFTHNLDGVLPPYTQLPPGSGRQRPTKVRPNSCFLHGGRQRRDDCSKAGIGQPHMLVCACVQEMPSGTSCFQAASPSVVGQVQLPRHQPAT